MEIVLSVGFILGIIGAGAWLDRRTYTKYHGPDYNEFLQ